MGDCGIGETMVAAISVHKSRTQFEVYVREPMIDVERDGGEPVYVYEGSEPVDVFSAVPRIPDCGKASWVDLLDLATIVPLYSFLGLQSDGTTGSEAEHSLLQRCRACDSIIPPLRHSLLKIEVSHSTM